MFKPEELYAAPEYWLERIQNELYRQLSEYLERNEMSRTEFAKKLGVSKAYVSQILNGQFNFTLNKLIELSLKMERVPEISFRPLENYIDEKTSQLQLNQAVRLSGKKGGIVKSISGRVQLSNAKQKFEKVSA